VDENVFLTVHSAIDADETETLVGVEEPYFAGGHR
jgi:hypothetical protein